MEISKLKRFKEVLKVFAKYDGKFLIKKIQSKKPIKPVYVRKAFEELGGGFVKLGQFLSLRTDLVSKEYSKEFSKLQDKVKPFSNKEAHAIIKKECKDLFKDIESEPFASASIAQTYKATYHTGQKVIVKVQRPGVAEKIQEDIAILHYIGKFFKSDVIDIKQIADEIVLI